MDKTEVGESVNYLGIIIKLMHGGIFFSLSDARIEKLIYYITSHISSGLLSPGDASSLAGKL